MTGTAGEGEAVGAQGRVNAFLRRWRLPLAVAALVVAVSLPVVRLMRHMNTPGRVDSAEWALWDFRDNVYYPERCFLSGGNPYDHEVYLARYPVRVRFPPYTPLYLLLHLPFGLLPHKASHLLYFGISIGLTLVLAILTLRMCGRRPSAWAVIALTALALLSRPGHRTLVLGQTTLEFVIVTYLALYLAPRSPWRSGLALAIASMKPTIVVPLGLIMVAQGFRRSVAIGAGVAFAATLIPTLVLARSAGGVVALARTYLGSSTIFEHDPSANPLLSTSRIDVAALISRLLGVSVGPVVEVALLALILGVAWFTMRRIRATTSGRQGELYATATACLTMLIALYQQTYSALFLILPLTALVLNVWAPPELGPTRTWRVVLLALLAVPVVNNMIADRVLRHIDVGSGPWTIATSLNATALLLAFMVYVVLVFHRTGSPPSATDHAV